MNAETIVKNAVQCGLCGAPADLHNRMYYQCQKNPNHVGDTWVGIFSDLSYPTQGVKNEDRL